MSAEQFHLEKEIVEIIKEVGIQHFTSSHLRNRLEAKFGPGFRITNRTQIDQAMKSLTVQNELTKLRHESLAQARKAASEEATNDQVLEANSALARPEAGMINQQAAQLMNKLSAAWGTYFDLAEQLVREAAEPPTSQEESLHSTIQSMKDLHDRFLLRLHQQQERAHSVIPDVARFALGCVATNTEETVSVFVMNLEERLQQHWSAFTALRDESKYHILIQFEKAVQKKLLQQRAIVAVFSRSDENADVSSNVPVTTAGRPAVLELATNWTEFMGGVHFKLRRGDRDVPFTEIVPEIRVGQWVEIQRDQETDIFQCEVRSITENLLVLKQRVGDKSNILQLTRNDNREINIRCLPNEWPLNTMLTALTDEGAKRYLMRLKSPAGGHERSTSLPHRSHLRVHDFPSALRNLNDEQMRAVQNILAGPSMYTLWGPAGTGKTSVLVAAVHALVQRWQAEIKQKAPTDRKPHKKLIICASTELAVNVIAKRLQDDGMTSILRIFTESVSPHDVYHSPYRSLLNFSQPSFEGKVPSIGDKFERIKPEDVERVFVVCATNLAASIMLRMNLQFEYVFIDEAGQVVEAEILVPAGLAREGTTLVISGDPMQLGPVLLSPTSRYGLSTSILKRYFPTYKHVVSSGDAVSERMLISAFRNCYRCHPEIVQLLNHLFYCGHLEPARWPIHCAQEISSLFPNRKVPLVFVDVEELLCRFESFSLRSDVEAHVASMIVGRLHEHSVPCGDIGIITPYTEQYKHLVSRVTMSCQHLPHWRSIRIGRIDHFQGQEMPVCIVSTVTACLSNPKGFLSRENIEALEAFTMLGDEGRTNVALSRATSAVILIGSSQRMYRDDPSLWGEIHDYLSKRSCVTSVFKLFPDLAVQVQRMLALQQHVDPRLEHKSATTA